MQMSSNDFGPNAGSLAVMPPLGYARQYRPVLAGSELWKTGNCHMQEACDIIDVSTCSIGTAICLSQRLHCLLQICNCTL